VRKKITRQIKTALPDLYDYEGNLISKQVIANKILDSIDNPEKLDLQPFETWVPFICSGCPYNGAYKLMGCIYDLYDEKFHEDNLPPKNCPLGYSS
jgi:hypothetical protein